MTKNEPFLLGEKIPNTPLASKVVIFYRPGCIFSTMPFEGGRAGKKFTSKNWNNKKLLFGLQIFRL
jgi:hypothetical protein